MDAGPSLLHAVKLLVPSIRRRALASGISAVLVADAGSGHALENRASRVPTPNALTVTNCDDDGPGSLRVALASPANFDSIDLTQLTCSVITLTSGQLATSLDTVTLNGSGQTISAVGNSRVIAHYGDGTLSATGILFAEGAIFDQNRAYGQSLLEIWNSTIAFNTATLPAGPYA